MVDFKKIISEKIGEITNVDSKNIYEFIETPPNKEMGDYAFPCFKLAKDLKKAPPVIANELKDKLTFENNEIVKIEIAGGYLNFYVNAQMLISEVLTEVEKLKENYGSSKVGEGKNIVIDYSSPNIAKPFHIGHLRTTVIGNSIYKLYKFLGYNCIGVNHLGDWGTQFGKLIEGLDVAKKIVSTKRDYSDKPYEDQVMKKVTVDTFGENFGEPEIIED